MKRILATLLAVVMILSCTLTFASCSMFDPKPETDLEDAKKNLEDKDYVVLLEEAGKENDLGIGIDSILYAYDLKPLMAYLEDEGEDFAEWKEDQGDEFVEAAIAALAMLEENWVLKITVYEDKKLAGYAYDTLELRDKMAADLEKAAEKDAKKHSETYNQELVDEKYEDKYSKITYERAQHILDEYSRDLSDDEKLMYEEIVDNYENGDDEWFYGKKGTAVWEGTKQAIKDSK